MRLHISSPVLTITLASVDSESRRKLRRTLGECSAHDLWYYEHDFQDPHKVRCEIL